MKKLLLILLFLPAFGFSQSFPGCIDTTALNYDPIATFNDGSCLFDYCNYTYYSLSGYSSSNPNISFGGITPPNDSSIFNGYVNSFYSCFIHLSTISQTTLNFSGLTLNATLSHIQFDTILGLPTYFDVSCDSINNICSISGNSNECLEIYSDSIIQISDTGTYNVQIPVLITLINIPIIGSLTQSDTINYILEINIPLNGCMDSLALNYDSTANIDDGSCLYAIYGCTDSLADNYDSMATIDDSSCTYFYLNSPKLS